MYDQAWVTIFSPTWEALTFWEFVLLATSIILALWFFLAIAFILWGWLLLILSWGKEEKTKPAINTIRYAILGIFITVGAIFIAPILWKLLWMWDIVEQYFSPTKIYDNITQITTKIFWGTDNWWVIRRSVNNSNSSNLDDLDF